MGSRKDFGGIEVGLTNLDKVLYPATGTTKGEVIAYFTAIAPALLPHIAERPVTRKRWPNGVDESSFFEKNLPDHAPKWLERREVQHSDRTVVYPLIDSVAGMAWLGQQAALELHVPQWRFDGAEVGPITRLVFDLDPGPGAGLAQCAEVALILRDVVREVGLDAFPVTSGSKGIHVYVPLDRKLGPNGASAVAKQVATNLQKLRPDLVTATMAKSARENKVFLDWSQNNPAKTTIAPYSLRGRTEPWVAAPRSWAEIEQRKKLRHLRFDEVLKRWNADGDLLAGLDDPLPEPVPDKLNTYRSMRDAARTPEPVPLAPPQDGPGDRFVVQEHHARRLHWDVRLERDGVLVSWAVPKGPPIDSHENRLAVHTEDHPLEYLTFHGSIPKGEYGGGEMTIWDTGTYETEKWRDDEVIVRFHGERLDGRYALIQTNGNQWLMHLMKDQRGPNGHQPEGDGAQRAPKSDAPFPHGLKPMLATPGEVANLDPETWAFETKWDGFRLIAEIEDDAVVLRSRAGHVVTGKYPGLGALGEELSGHRVVLDGEAVVFDDHGGANLGLLRADSARAVFVAFDVLYLDGTSLVRKRYEDRRRVLEALAAQAPSLHVPPRLDGSGAEALRYSQEHGMEGVVAKRRDSVYLPGKRGQSWLKTRNWRTLSVVIGGYRRSEVRQFASLLIGVPHEGELYYLGRVGTGFTEQEMSQLADQLRRLERRTSPFGNELTAEERKDAVWVTPRLTGTVRFMNWTEAGRLWHPAWIPASD
ncbi:ATP-dependent DNA ligase [Nocardia yamanashiensis]|uniref:ATP-dependent DNA ligase n=1 Tax=Nocardia yamanashiensis TaxID=209247 RepID=UPI001E3C0474|nr:ATP-dependent DNA ligase [Nocardia yamanashiensis]UGT39841.1 ATP-dependent DNA ligase [Nocardia yamanashiensis]